MAIQQRLRERCLSLALSLHPNDTSLRCHHYAFLIRNGRIFKIGWNKRKTHPITARYNYHEGIVYIHAELDVILKSKLEDLSEYSLFSVRIMKNGEFGLARPCSGCSSVLKQVGITQIEWTI